MIQKAKLPAKTTITAKKASAGAAVKTTRSTRTTVALKTSQVPPRVTVKKAPVKKPSVVSKATKITPALPAKNTKPLQVKVVAKAAPVSPSDQQSKGEKKKRQKMVRDSFNMPESDYAHIAALKKRCLKAGTSAKKSEVLRAALKCLSGLSDLALTKAISELEPVKTGRPSKR